MADPGSSVRRRREERERRRDDARDRARDQARLERRRAEELERVREEERREEARIEAQALEAMLAAQQERREASRAALRAHKLAERRDEQKREEKHDALLNILRQANRAAQRAEQEKTARTATLRQQLVQGEREAQQQNDRREGRRATARQERRDESQAAEQTAEKRETRREAARDAQRDERRVADQALEQREARGEAERDERRDADQARARSEAERDATSVARRDARRDAERAQTQRVSALQERLDESRQQARAADRQTTARQERDDERRRANQEDARREAAREARAAARRQAQEAAQRAEDLRELARLARRDEQAEAERADARGRARRSALRAADVAARRPESDRERGASTRGAPREDVSRGRPSLERARQRDPLRDRIPAGTLSGALPWLRVSGRRVVNLAGDPIILRGVSLLGLESAAPDRERGFASAAGLTRSTIGEVLGWGATVIRVAINCSRVMDGYAPWSAANYLAELDGIIEQAAAGGAYTMLSLRRLDEVSTFGTVLDQDGKRVASFVPPQPDFEAIRMWRSLGERYAEEPAVLFDLFTAPHAPFPDGVTGQDPSWEGWTLWVRTALVALRRIHPRALCLVSGLTDGADLSGFPVRDITGEPIPNLIYAAHLYPHGVSPLAGMAGLGRSHALLVTEWGGERSDLAWGERTAVTLAASGIGWVAAHWNAAPRLVHTVNGRLVATPFGLVVQRALTFTDVQPITAHPLHVPLGAISP